MDGSTIGMIIFIIILLGLVVLLIASMWRLFEKAGEPGWACIIPIYNYIVFLRIIGKPWWWLLLMCITPIGFIWGIWSANMLSKSFGKDEGFTAGLVFLGIIFIPILGFGDAQYMGPYGNRALYDAYQRRNNPAFDFENNILEN